MSFKQIVCSAKGNSNRPRKKDKYMAISAEKQRPLSPFSNNNAWIHGQLNFDKIFNESFYSRIVMK